MDREKLIILWAGPIPQLCGISIRLLQLFICEADDVKIYVNISQSK